MRTRSVRPHSFAARGPRSGTIEDRGGRRTRVATRPRVAPLASHTLHLATVIALAVAATPAAAQTDYYNTDAGRPFRIEDAQPVERRAFEIQAAPFRVERSRNGAYRWELEPEVAYGILPRTSVEVGVPFAFVEDAGESTSGISGIHLSAFHNLNVETSIPALAVAASVLLPVGAMEARDPYATVKAMLTRSFTILRVHLNGEYTFGSRVGVAGTESAVAPELSAWMSGIAVDRVFALRAMLVGAEVFVREPLGVDEELEWNTSAGIRYQLDPRFSIDGGVGRRLTGDDRGWYVTFGTAYAVGLPWYP